jgi:hypothetical protein
MGLECNNEHASQQLEEDRVMRVPALLALAACLAAGVPSHAQTTLRWKLAPGETLHYQRTHNRNTLRRTPAGEIKESLLRITDMSMGVDQVDSDGTATVTLFIDRIRYRKQSLAGDVEHDSATEARQKLPASIQRLLGVAFSFKLSPRGIVTSIKVTRLTRPRSPEGAPRQLSLSTAESVVQLIPFVELPEAAVSTGSSWQQQVESVEPVLGKRTSTVTYKYIGKRPREGKEIELLGLNAKMRFAPPEQDATRVEVKEASAQGTVEFDSAAGRVRLKDETERLKFVLTESGRSTEQVIESTIRIALVP